MHNMRKRGAVIEKEKVSAMDRSTAISRSRVQLCVPLLIVFCSILDAEQGRSHIASSQMHAQKLWNLNARCKQSNR